MNHIQQVSMLIVMDEYPLSENISNRPSIHIFGQPKYFILAVPTIEL